MKAEVEAARDAFAREVMISTLIFAALLVGIAAFGLAAGVVTGGAPTPAAVVYAILTVPLAGGVTPPVLVHDRATETAWSC